MGGFSASFSAGVPARFLGALSGETMVWLLLDGIVLIEKLETWQYGWMLFSYQNKKNNGLETGLTVLQYLRWRAYIVILSVSLTEGAEICLFRG